MNSLPAEGRCPVAPIGFDLLDPAALRAPSSAYVSARQEMPVFWYPSLNVWIITCYQDVFRYLNDQESFRTSNRDAVTVPEGFAERYPASLLNHILPALDPPALTAPKRVLQEGFSKPRLRSFEQRITTRAHKLIDGFEAEGKADLLQAYCAPLTMHTLLGLLGLPDNDADRVRRLGDAAIRVLASAHVPLDEPELSEVWEEYIEGQEYFRRIADERATAPGDDVISLLATATDDRAPAARLLDRERVALIVTELAFTGHDTTAQLMASMLAHLSEFPALREELRRDPGLWPNVAEESLRRHPPATFAARAAVRDLEIGGALIRKGDTAWFALAGASNDPAHYDDPEVYDIRRPRPTDHLSFGRGPHACPGSPLARLQATLGVRILLERLPDLSTDPDDPATFAPTVIVSKRDRMPVRWSQVRQSPELT
ncbi:cytochrome P450 [Saccharopolyspora spinosa]|uniref:Cytochrome P450 n=2 Tax=Saccharopolyspora spinosa TaxID=60894 RepID=A0A2N3Y1C8_SACSN|nr:cytochrome P450 [Saccharopolyspora spinosa]PKW16661.1 hypothetical protein A8926_4515 [Saccharopolyspora spinosa]